MYRASLSRGVSLMSEESQTENTLIPETLYHYCSADAFLKIIESKSIWLSSVLGFNDYMETKWIDHLIDVEIQKRRGNGHDKFLDFLIHSYNNNRNSAFAFVACFSSGRDVLSQWRAYASDGSGFAIGFNSQYFHIPYHVPLFHVHYLSQRDIGIHDVIYDISRQREALTQAIEAGLNEYSRENPLSIIRGASKCVDSLWQYSHIFKNQAFREELEWRIMYMRKITQNEDSEMEKFEAWFEQELPVNFRATDRSIIPYFELPFSEPGKIAPINEVILGPKNETEQMFAEMLLDFNDFKGVIVRQSDASYR
jgi:hypothetical protein